MTPLSIMALRLHDFLMIILAIQPISLYDGKMEEMS